MKNNISYLNVYIKRKKGIVKKYKKAQMDIFI